ncbi:uncharacterized protein LOC111915215 [Lactuca sativa]|uniref:Transmembrane protein n=1 Tax=Lactuca sativa TaxID=4236 RepID=A0A9R1WN13_LACSA|nr:uncharacterized protein LOC111915215 [Lactuca sativa]KAJ0226664.1 hypothetical protein LSAT_V11C100021730 [Lactuca sativa]
MDGRSPPPPLIHLRTTTQILKQTTTIFSIHHHLLIFILLSFLILSLRSNVETATHSLTSFIDHDPSIKSLLSRLHISSNPASPPAITHRHRRRPFLQLTRVGTLDDDFFSGDEELDHRFFGTLPRPQLNATSFIVDFFDPQRGFSNFISDNGIRVSEIVRSHAKVSFKSVEAIEKEEKTDTGNTNSPPMIKENESDTIDDLQLFLKRFELEHHEMTALLFLLGVLSASYGFAILGFVVTYAWVLGIIFVVVMNDLLKGHKSFLRTLWDGSNLGLKRLSGYIVMRWAVRDALTQLLGVWFFGEIEDQYLFFKIFVRLKLMPFSIVSPWVKGFEREIYGFLLSWFLLDTLVSFVFAVDAWIAMVDTRKSVKEVVKEGCHLLSLMLHPAINLKCLEGIICGSFARWVLSRFFGKLFASAFQSFMEVYFMVAWLLYYLSVKSKDANSNGTPFGERELEGLLEDVR